MTALIEPFGVPGNGDTLRGDHTLTLHGAGTRGRRRLLRDARLAALAWMAMLVLAGLPAAAGAAGPAALAGTALTASPAVVAGSSAAAAIAGNAEAGRAEFARCQWCHQAGPSARSGFGPQLTGIVGRRAGAATDFKYSAAMKNAGIVWTEPMLAAFVKAPQKVVPDNKMRFWGISDEQRIANLLAYLRTL